MKMASMGITKKGIAKILGSAALLLSALAAGPVAAQGGRGDVVYVPTPQIVVDTMLEMAKVSARDFLIDLGSGDGRFVITAATKYGASAFGVDLDTFLLKIANQNAQKAGVTDKVRFIEENLFTTDLSRATVISTYLLPEMNLRLRPKFMAMKPGTRIVTHDYNLGEWGSEEERELIVPEKKVGNPGVSYLFFYVVPAQVPGKWQSLVNIGGRDMPLEFDLQQKFQEVEGKVDIRDRSTGLRGRIMGENIRIVAGGRDGIPRHEFAGKIGDGTIQGTLVIGEGTTRQQVAWTAKQIQRGELKRAADELPEEK
jgi:16S rRNA G966 N2-methylase RsmD